MGDDFPRVNLFFGSLFGEITRKTLQVLGLTPDGQGAITVGGTEFLIKLAVKFGQHFGGDFRGIHHGPFVSFLNHGRAALLRRPAIKRIGEIYGLLLG
jgi:hypothetical protein